MEEWERLEQYVSVITHGRIVPGSGRFSVKGDIRTKNLYIECKYRTSKAKKITLPLSWFKTSENETKGTDLIPIIAFRSSQDHTVSFFCRKLDSELFEEVECQKILVPGDWVCISEGSIKEFCNESKSQEGI